MNKVDCLLQDLMELKKQNKNPLLDLVWGGLIEKWKGWHGYVYGSLSWNNAQGLTKISNIDCLITELGLFGEEFLGINDRIQARKLNK